MYLCMYYVCTMYVLCMYYVCTLCIIYDRKWLNSEAHNFNDKCNKRYDDDFVFEKKKIILNLLEFNKYKIMVHYLKERLLKI